MALIVLTPVFTPAREVTRKGRRMALLVGVNAYDRRETGELESAIRDIEGFREELEKAGFDEIRMLPSVKGKDNGGRLPANEPTAANGPRALEE
jgi:hypothetical protein